MQKKVIYVTGCLGFMGAYFTRKCLDMGWYVRGIDKITYAASLEALAEFSKHPNFHFEKLDINNLTRIADCDYFVNYCAESHVDNSIVNSQDFFDSNIRGVYTILQLIRAYQSNGYKVPIFYHLSTDETYGDIPHGSHVETDLLKPSNPYSATKASADMLIVAWARTFGIRFNIIRPTNNYGIGQYVEKLIPKTCQYINLGKRVELHNRGTPKRVWLHADDTAEAILAIIRSGNENEIYNVSGNYEDTNINVIRKIVNCWLGRPLTQEIDLTLYADLEFSRSGQDVRYSLDDSKIKTIGWRPRKVFDIELPDIVRYYRNHFTW